MVDEIEPLCCEILKYILWGFRGWGISRLAGHGVGNGVCGDLVCPYCGMGVNSGCRRTPSREFVSFCHGPIVKDF